MKKLDLENLIASLTVKKHHLEETYHQQRDDMYETQGAMGEIEALLYKLEKLK